MVTNRILLFGGSGQIGNALQKQALPADTRLFAPTRAECDLMQPESIAKAVREYAPDLVINAAALTSIDACENDPQRATEINFHAVANIAAQCDTVNAPLIQISTDNVFDGVDGDRPYRPDDAMNPVNVYGQTKMMGEEAARHGLHWHVIVRASMVFSAFGENVLTRTLRQIDTQDEVVTTVDQRSNPTSATFLAEAILTMAHAILRGKGNGFGTYHVSGEPAATRFEFLQAIMEAYAPFTERRPLLRQVSTAGVPRPLYACLNNDKACEVYGIQPRPWRDDLARAVKEYVENRNEK